MINNVPFALLDTDKSFIIVTDNISVEIEYGQFALTIINTNYGDMISCIESFIQNNHILQLAEQIQNRRQNLTLDSFVTDYVLSGIYSPLEKVLEKSNLSSQQKYAIIQLLILEIIDNISQGEINLSDACRYVPSVFTNKELHIHIKNSLLKKSSAFTSVMQEDLNNMDLSTSIMTLADGTPVTVFFLKDTLSYLVLDMQKYLLSRKQVLECERCGRLFYPLYRNSEKYCRLSNDGTELTCDVLAHRKIKDSFARARNAARGYQYNRCNNASTQKKYKETPKFLEKIYNEWSIDCTANYNNYKANDDFEGFKAWISLTKFTAEHLEELFQKYNKK